MEKFIFNPNPLMVLSYLSKNKNAEFLYGSKVANELGINQGGTSVILKSLKKMGILKSENVGKTLAYSVYKEHPLLKSFRVFENILEINSLIEDIKSECKKIILFGSCATGEDDKDSDIDLFVLANDKEMIRDKISNYQIDREINPVILTPLELVDFEKEDAVFYKEILKGLELWGGLNE